jgi:apolipoprotein N-acyltransferase
VHRTLLFDRQFWRFYGRLVWRMLSILWTAADRYLTVVGVASFFAVLLNPEIAALAESAWAGISRWWSLVPLGVLFAYGLMKANYEAFQEVEGARARLQESVETEEKRAAIGQGLQQLYSGGAELRAEIMSSTDETPATECEEKLTTWRQSVIDYLVENASVGKAQYVDGVQSVKAASISGMKSHATRGQKETMVLHLQERLKRLAEVMREY